jgi:hypothetical protein
MREGAMRFIYGFILGVLVSVITAILYLAFLGGDYLLQLSPRYHDMASTIASLREAKEQRDQLAVRLDALADGFDQLTRRFNELQETVREPPAPRRGPGSEAPAPEPTPRPRPRAEPPPLPSPAL